MAATSTIEWTEKTWNPTIGCRRVSAGCDNCYAINVANRFRDQFSHYAGVTERRDGRTDWTGRYNAAPDHIINEPLGNRKPTVYFVNSMSDLFGEGVDDATIQRVFGVMNSCPQHTFQVLTKRPNRAVKMADSLNWTANIWMGTSIEMDKFVGRADLLRKIPAAVRIISAEPLLSGLPSLDLAGIHWLIAGGESGHGSRQMSIDWARDLRDRCIAAGVSFFFKQWGNWNQHGVRHQGKKDAGRELDGRTWDEMPGDREPVVAGDKSRWMSIVEFRDDLAFERASEEQAPAIGGQSPRIALREPIWRALQDIGPTDAVTLRDRVLTTTGLDADSARIVNYHAWALVDLQASGFVRSFTATVAGKRGRLKTVKHYAAIKPRIRVRQQKEI